MSPVFETSSTGNSFCMSPSEMPDTRLGRLDGGLYRHRAGQTLGRTDGGPGCRAREPSASTGRERRHRVGEAERARRPRLAHPKYQEIADRLRAQIGSGALAPGQRLPIEPDLAAQYDAPRN